MQVLAGEATVFAEGDRSPVNSHDA